MIVLVLAVLALHASVSAAPASATPGPASAPEWWFDAWKIPALWAAGADGRGITVAVVDTGVQATVPELAGKVLPGADYIGNGSDGRTDFDGDQFSHGTAMASLMVARAGYGDIEGVAPAARILPLAVPLNGVIRRGTPVRNATAVAVRYAADHGAKVISMSLGGVVYADEDPDPCPGALQQAVLYALSRGALVIAASGNSGDAGNPVEEPGVCLGVISVGAVDSALTVSSFSSRHTYLDLTAPGEQIPTLSRETRSAFIGDGTSQATALAAGAVAMVWSKFPAASNSQIASRVIASAIDRGLPGRDSAYGYGVIDPAAAIAANAAAARPNPVFAGAQPLLSLMTPAPPVPGIAPAGTASATLGSFRRGSTAVPAGLSVYLPAGVAVLFVVLAALLLVRTFRRPRPRPVTARSG